MKRTLVTLDDIDGITIDPADAPFGNYQVGPAKHRKSLF
jgi:hypothetical protein